MSVQAWVLENDMSLSMDKILTKSMVKMVFQQEGSATQELELMTSLKILAIIPTQLGSKYFKTQKFDQILLV